jgi:hypothetical protein
MHLSPRTGIRNTDQLCSRAFERSDLPVLVAASVVNASARLAPSPSHEPSHRTPCAAPNAASAAASVWTCGRTGKNSRACPIIGTDDQHGKRDGPVANLRLFSAYPYRKAGPDHPLCEPKFLHTSASQIATVVATITTTNVKSYSSSFGRVTAIARARRLHIAIPRVSLCCAARFKRGFIMDEAGLPCVWVQHQALGRARTATMIAYLGRFLCSGTL